MYHLFYRDRKTTVKAAVDRSQDRYLSVQSFSSSFWSSAISSAASFLIVITSFGDNKFASPPDPSSHPSIHPSLISSISSLVGSQELALSLAS